MHNVISYLNNLLHDNDIIVVATSGGPDSMCLLNIIVNLKLKLKIIVAHVNHKLRVESEEEAQFVEKFCLDNNLIYEYMEIKEYNHNNLENEARIKRYEFFNKLIVKYKANYLMTAHHGDDLMETILMRLTRGSSIKGYSGFKKCVSYKDYKLIRPLITVTKDDITHYMDSNNYKYYLDKSNLSREYTRNRYRMDILPFFKKENKDVHLKFLKFSEELEEANIFIDNYIKILLKDIETSKGLDIIKLRELNSFLLKKVIEYQLSLIYINDLFLVSDRNTLEIIKLINSKNSNEILNLPNNYIAIKEYNYLKIEHNKKSEDYDIELKDIVRVPTGIIKVVDSSSLTSNYVIRLNSKNLKLPLRVRNRREGDKMAIKNLNGHKKIKDIFIDLKIPKAKRDVFPIVIDSNNEIVWLPGVKKSKFDVEKDGIYDIILSYEEDFNEYKRCEEK
ncbi:MAG: tRNA lysidine(34) synthetase TilS [Ruminococcus sp.]|nr:tRNA lysidine(34) synthetase TilS [Ruminococcus sp.]